MRAVAAALGIISTTIALTGCIDQRSRTYVSPLEFKDYSCNQLTKEMTYTSSQLDTATTDNQTSQMVDAAIALYQISQGNDASPQNKNTNKEDEIARLNSKYTALHQVSIEKDCD